MNKKKSISSDIIVMGNGITSQFFSLALSKTVGERIKISQIDKKIKAQDYVRALSISLSTVNICKALDIWSLIEPYCYPVKKIIVTHRNIQKSKGSILEFDNQIDQNIASYIINESDLRNILSQQIVKYKNIELFETEIDSLDIDNQSARISSDRYDFSSKLIVAGDGRSSIIKKILGIKSITWDYDQTALSCLITHSKKNDNIAIENFLNSGPIAILPFGDYQSSLIWSGSRSFMNNLKKADIDQLLEEVQTQTKGYIGEISSIENIGYFDLNFSIIRKLIDRRVAFIGDAAHSVHPLAGQGTNIGLRDVAYLSENIIDSIKYGLDFSDKNALQEYERKRMPDIITSAMTFDAINRLYSNNIRAIEPLKDFAINFVSKVPTLKKSFVEEGAGTKRAMSKLIQGIPIS
jgi:2-octaprenyl-6-methoxyphenol hydroxylase